MTLSSKYNYHDLFKKYNMDGDIRIGTGMVRVHDIFNPLPDFMHKADVIFCDPPCSKGNLTSFYTKADKDEKPYNDFNDFERRLFDCIKEVHPKLLILETFKSNHEHFLEKVKSIYKNVIVKDSMYYNKPANKCNIIIASNDLIPDCLVNLPFMDEEAVIEYICKNLEYNCIGDFCMGKGLVGFYSDKYGKPFVGTELNKKRLAVLLERITTKSRGHIN